MNRIFCISKEKTAERYEYRARGLTRLRRKRHSNRFLLIGWKHWLNCNHFSVVFCTLDSVAKSLWCSHHCNFRSLPNHKIPVLKRFHLMMTGSKQIFIIDTPRLNSLWPGLFCLTLEHSRIPLSLKVENRIIRYSHPTPSSSGLTRGWQLNVWFRSI